MLKTFLDLHPTVLHDLHESVTLLYISTGTGPYNPIVDPIQVNEWWLLAQNEIMEMTKRDVPGVWTYNYYDGWVPNYMFWIGVTHNSIGRFYETQSYGQGRGVTDGAGKVVGATAANAVVANRGVRRWRPRRRSADEAPCRPNPRVVPRQSEPRRHEVERARERQHAAERAAHRAEHASRRTRRSSSRTTT